MPVFDLRRLDPPPKRMRPRRPDISDAERLQRADLPQESGRARRLAAAVAILAALPATAAGGLRDTPVPNFSNGNPGQIAFLVPQVLTGNGMETDVICTNLGTQNVDIGLEAFDASGAPVNAVASNNGVAFGVPPGQTVTLATGRTGVLHEDIVLTLGAPAPRITSARVIASGEGVGCVAYAADARHRVEDPAVCPGCKPPTLILMPGSPPCVPGACDDFNACTEDECDDLAGCSNTAVADGTPCDDGDACTVNDACVAGACTATPKCGPDTPCHSATTCDPGIGECVDIAPVSACVPGGGKADTDCAAEWVVENPGNPTGQTGKTHVCRQGDGTCDFDADSRQCTFRVRICLNNRDVNLPACEPGQVSSYDLRKPATRSKQRSVRANAEAILSAVAGLASSTRGGKGFSQVLFDPPNGSADDCTPEVALTVRRGRTLAVKAQVRSPFGVKDNDKLKLKCAKPKKGG